MSDIEQKKARLKAAKEQMQLALAELDRALNDLGEGGWQLSVDVERSVITHLGGKGPIFAYRARCIATRTEEI